jgi:hypothetical protein
MAFHAIAHSKAQGSATVSQQRDAYNERSSWEHVLLGGARSVSSSRTAL